MREMYPNRAMVLGFGASGYFSARALAQRGVSTVVVEARSRQAFEASSELSVRVAELEQLGVQFQFDATAEQEIFGSVQLVIVSPGVSWQHPWVLGAKAQGVEQVYGELEWALLQLAQPTILVTGSNGKTTTVQLIRHLLEGCGVTAYAAGNCGPALSSLCQIDSPSLTAEAVLVIEASSYQLEASQELVPDVGVLLNLSENHLERHGTMADYARAKLTPFVRMSVDHTLVYGSALTRHSVVADQLQSLICKRSAFGTEPGLAAQVSDLRRQIDLPERQLVLNLSQVALLGEHNQLNMAAAVLAVIELFRWQGKLVDAGMIDLIEQALKTFAPLEHRIEPCEATAVGVWINDSKSTTPSSTLVAVKTVVSQWPDKKTLLLIGGQMKQASWEEVWSFLDQQRERIAGVVCFGQAAKVLREQAAAWSLALAEAANLEQAVSIARSKATLDSVVLFSPGCASFDQFTSFEERGRVLKNLINSALPETVS